MLLNCGIGEDSWESFGLQGGQTNQSQRKSVLNILWKDWCWSWNSSTLATWCEEPTHWKRPWCWEGLKAGGEGDNRGWDDQLNGHEFEQASGEGEWQGSLVYCRPWDHRVGQDWAAEQQHACDYFHCSIIESSFLFMYCKSWKLSVLPRKDRAQGRFCGSAPDRTCVSPCGTQEAAPRTAGLRSQPPTLPFCGQLVESQL